MAKDCAAFGALILAVISIIVSIYSIGQGREFFVLQPKRDVLRRYMGHAHQITGDKGFSHLYGKEPFIALNEARAVFADNEEIIGLLRRLSDSKKQSELHVQLMRAMGKASGFDLSEWSDDFLLSPFTPRS